jgi:hypothetical protein
VIDFSCLRGPGPPTATVYLHEREWPLLALRLRQMQEEARALGPAPRPAAARTLHASLLRQALCYVTGLPLEALAGDELVELVYVADAVQEARRRRLAELCAVEYRPDELAGLPAGTSLPGRLFAGRLDRAEPSPIVLL